MATCCFFLALKVDERVMPMAAVIKWANHVYLTMQ